MRNSADVICRLCESGAETTEHMVSKCSELAGIKTIHKRKPFLNTQEVMRKVPKEVVGFINTSEDLLGFPRMSRAENKRST